MLFKTIEWKNNKVVMLDQRKLPNEEIYNTYSNYKEVGQAIKDMVIRGAPAIGVAAAMGVALGAQKINAKDYKDFEKQLTHICDTLFKTRPTAVNLGWGLNRMKEFAKANQNLSMDNLKEALKNEAIHICKEDIEINRNIGKNGEVLFESGDHVLTHCNAGALATAGFGTALGVLYAAKEKGKSFSVFARFNLHVDGR